MPPRGWAPGGAPEQPGKRSAWGNLLIVVVAVAIIGGFAVFLYLRGKGPLPSELMGIPRVDNQMADSMEEMLDGMASAVDGDAHIGIYGSGTPPKFVLMVLTIPESADAAGAEDFNEGFVEGFTSSSGATLDPSSTTEFPVDGATIECSSMTQEAGVVCLWRSGDLMGALIETGSGDVDAAGTAATEAYQATADL